jgi:hypothetical protein
MKEKNKKKDCHWRQKSRQYLDKARQKAFTAIFWAAHSLNWHFFEEKNYLKNKRKLFILQ